MIDNYDTTVDSVKVHALQITRPDKAPIRVIMQPAGNGGCLIVECGNQAWSRWFSHARGLPFGRFIATYYTEQLVRALHPSSQKYVHARAKYLTDIVLEVQEVLRDLC